MALFFLATGVVFAGLFDGARDPAVLPHRERAFVPEAGLSKRLGALFILTFAGLFDLACVEDCFTGAPATSMSPFPSEAEPSSVVPSQSGKYKAFDGRLPTCVFRPSHLLVFAFLGLALALVTLAGDAAGCFGGLPLGRGEAVVGSAFFLGLPLGLGDAVADFVGLLSFFAAAGFGVGVAAFPVSFTAGVAVVLTAGDFDFVAAAFLSAADAVSVDFAVSDLAAALAAFAAAGFLRALASFLTVEVVFAGDAFLVTFAASSASAFFVDTAAFRGERRRGGSGVADALAFPIALPLFGEHVVFAFAMGEME